MAKVQFPGLTLYSANGLTVALGTSALQDLTATTGDFTDRVTVASNGIAIIGNSTITGTLSGITTLSATEVSVTAASGATALLVAANNTYITFRRNDGVTTASFARMTSGDLFQIDPSGFGVECGGNFTTDGTLATQQPGGGGNGPAVRIGAISVVSPTSPNRTLKLEVGGTSYYVACKTTND